MNIHYLQNANFVGVVCMIAGGYLLYGVGTTEVDC